MNATMKTLSGMAMGVALLVAGVVFAEDKTAANTAPVGQVCKQGEACASAVAAASGGAAKSGADVFNGSCTSCHSTGAAGAPKVGDAAAWNPRITERGGKEGLYGSAVNGFKGMPAKGLCFACTDDEIKGAVDYMLSQIK
jgi:cytochrome c5